MSGSTSMVEQDSICSMGVRVSDGARSSSGATRMTTVSRRLFWSPRSMRNSCVYLYGILSLRGEGVYGGWLCELPVPNSFSFLCVS